jgi:hypothetical protein
MEAHPIRGSTVRSVSGMTDRVDRLMDSKDAAPTEQPQTDHRLE